MRRGNRRNTVARRGFPATARHRGLRMGGRVLTYGVIPPAAGPSRVEWCLTEGHQHLQAAVREFGELLLGLVHFLPGGLTSLPTTYPLETHHSSDERQQVGRRRVLEWFELRHELERREAALRTVADVELLGEPWTALEAVARSAVGHAGTAYHCLREARTEAADLKTHLGDPNDWPRIARQADRLSTLAHTFVHRIGELIGGLFGCRIEYDDGAWMKSCPVELLHIGVGYSPGYTARHTCSICGADIAQCDHHLGGRYQVVVQHDVDGNCNVCDTSGCAHTDGTSEYAIASPRLVDAVMHEVSLTERPRDPRSRIETIEVDPGTVAEKLGTHPHEGADIWHHICMYPCVESIEGSDLVGPASSEVR